MTALQTKVDPPAAPLPEMTLRDHLLELRRRLIASMIALVLGTFVGFYFVDDIFPLFTMSFKASFHDALLIGTSPSEAFMLKLKMAFFSGLVGVLPFLFYQVWLFVKPALYEEEQRLALPFVAVATLLFAAGVVFCHELVLPIALSFFADEYHSVGVTPTIKVSEHIALVIQSLVGFGVAFELPVISFLLARLGVIDYEMMRSTQRYALVLIFIVSAILTPPDVLSQFLMAGPLILLYGISMLIVKRTERKLEVPDEKTPNSSAQPSSAK